jgi:hypothetical protein
MGVMVFGITGGVSAATEGTGLQVGEGAGGIGGSSGYSGEGSTGSGSEQSIGGAGSTGFVTISPSQQYFTDVTGSGFWICEPFFSAGVGGSGVGVEDGGGGFVATTI